MNWDAIGAIGQLLGSAAVFITLVYLAVQTRVANNVASDTNRQQRAQGVREMLLALATDDDLRHAWDKASLDDGGHAAIEAMAARLGVNRDEAERISWACQYWCWLHWSQWASMTTAADDAELRRLIANFYGSNPMRAFWELSPYVQYLDQPFIDFVNAALATGSGAEPISRGNTR